MIVQSNLNFLEEADEIDCNKSILALDAQISSSISTEKKRCIGAKELKIKANIFRLVFLE